MKNKILLFIFVSLFGASAVIEPISSASDFITGATYIASHSSTDQIAGASTDANGNYIEVPIDPSISSSTQTDIISGSSIPVETTTPGTTPTTTTTPSGDLTTGSSIPNETTTTGTTTNPGTTPPNSDLTTGASTSTGSDDDDHDDDDDDHDDDDDDDYYSRDTYYNHDEHDDDDEHDD
ncbi:MAG: hypothetical protein KKH01_07375 [Firmicutes bacterium]|nr:hypothetical protein [Bacillota bacterium]